MRGLDVKPTQLDVKKSTAAAQENMSSAPKHQDHYSARAVQGYRTTRMIRLNFFLCSGNVYLCLAALGKFLLVRFSAGHVDGDRVEEDAHVGHGVGRQARLQKPLDRPDAWKLDWSKECETCGTENVVEKRGVWVGGWLGGWVGRCVWEGVDTIDIEMYHPDFSKV